MRGLQPMRGVGSAQLPGLNDERGQTRGLGSKKEHGVAETAAEGAEHCKRW